MVHWIVHSEPYSKNPTENRENPEGFFRYSPPLIYRLQFIDTHDQIGKYIESNKNIKYILIHNYREDDILPERKCLRQREVYDSFPPS